MKLPGLWALTAFAIGLAWCSQEQVGYTDAERKCIAAALYGL